MSDPAARRLLWYLFAGSKGGENRIKIINLLQDTPLNINRMAEVLNLDYKAVQHHVGILFRIILNLIWIPLRKLLTK